MCFCLVCQGLHVWTQSRHIFRTHTQSCKSAGAQAVVLSNQCYSLPYTAVHQTHPIPAHTEVHHDPLDFPACRAINKLALLPAVLPPSGPATTEALQQQLRAARTHTQLWADVVDVSGMSWVCSMSPVASLVWRATTANENGACMHA